LGKLFLVWIIYLIPKSKLPTCCSLNFKILVIRLQLLLYYMITCYCSHILFIYLYCNTLLQFELSLTESYNHVLLSFEGIKMYKFTPFRFLFQNGTKFGTICYPVQVDVENELGQK